MCTCVDAYPSRQLQTFFGKLIPCTCIFVGRFAFSRSASYGELHLSCLFDDLRGLENFETDYATIVAEIGNDSGANLVAFLHARVAKRDGERIRFAVVFSFHERAAYFPNFDVFRLDEPGVKIV